MSTELEQAAAKVIAVNAQRRADANAWQAERRALLAPLSTQPVSLATVMAAARRLAMQTRGM